MLNSTNIPAKKIVILGLAESGKSTIIKSVIEGVKTDLGERYSATINYQRKMIHLCGLEISIFDLGGQTRFLDKFTGELSQFVFSSVDSFIFIIEPLQSAYFSRAKYYLELSLEKLKLFSPQAKIFLFLHKTDLIPAQNLNIISQNLKKYLTSEITYQIRYYNTSVFSESAFEAVGSVISEVLLLKERFFDIFRKYLDKRVDCIAQIHLLTHEGAFLLQISNERLINQVPLEFVKKFFDMALQQNPLLNKENSVVSVESNEQVYLIYFLERGLALMLVISKLQLLDNSKFSSEIYNYILTLAAEINTLSDFRLKEGK
ncbi:MAG: ADP-ribosylation factor-like protein [Candidatus Hodarchaeales archaeon]|jgi:GTPase SAR1 family protein